MLTKGSMYKDRSAITATFKTQINDKISLGFREAISRLKFSWITPTQVQVTLFLMRSSLPNPYVDLTIETMALLGRYRSV